MPNDAIEVQIEGSSGNPYLVSFYREGNFLRTSCTCPAGEKRTHCKHRLELFRGDLTRVRGSAQPDLAQRLSAMVQGTEVESACHALASAEAEVTVAAENLKRAKRALDRAMHK